MNIYQNKKIYYIIISFTFILFGFGGGYLTGWLIHKSDAPVSITEENTSIETYRPRATAQTLTAPEETITSEHYILRNDNDILRFYHVNGDEQILIKEVEINSDFLPVEDSEKLKKGISVATLEEGYALIEDFTS